jgi:hypothetical protein
MGAVLIGQAFHWMRRESVAREVARVLQPRGLWAVFWIQPVKPLPLSVRISDAVIAEVVPDYDPNAAHDLTSKSGIPTCFGFQVRTWTAEFAHSYRLEAYVNMVVSKSYVSAALCERGRASSGRGCRIRAQIRCCPEIRVLGERARAFRTRLSQQLRRNLRSTTVEERYLVTAHFAARSGRLQGGVE